MLKGIKIISVILVLWVVLGTISSIAVAPGFKNPSKGLSNSNASQEVENVYSYIYSLKGRGVLSGQQESTWVNNNPDYEMDYIKKISGKLPAIRGLDFINNDLDGVTNRAVKWWNQGGIPSICWHWGAPTVGIGYEASKGTIDINQALTPGTALNKAMMDDMARVAQELTRLRDAKVPVLWRPFHELNGHWFWWSKGGPEAFKSLWKLMYDCYTNTYELNNLIWVLGYAEKPDPAWYPGDQYVDIVGSDTYNADIQHGMYKALLNIYGDKMPIAYHECGNIPDPDEMKSCNTNWSWFLTWHTSFIKKENSASYVTKVYNHDFIITLDELPNLKDPNSKAGSNHYTYYKLANRKSGKLLDVKDVSGVNGADVIQWADRNGYNQQWRFVKTNDGYYKLVNRYSDLLLDVSQKSILNGARVVQWRDIGGHNQQWKYTKVEGEYFKLVNRYSGKCLDVSGGSKVNGGKVIQWGYTGGTNQQWKFVKVE
ncbi:glycosyl hydrolase [Pseudobacteroides cellulosolvens]|uniref:Mannan endo-1,4-beta-mannosidase n=1 Tax=Pseudobacteroides cellulosolvens ATCC 35603 = DSM 2933 TaxID=398512 RepID=A0A0L6JV08_9FIRM|nr:glycosyl hydrolase [Pseudobacteroides cellulosolvens]KNY29663.1 Mannan endo-1,4-beta-mannosidase [Pseudobacteroides cellulosolvens ATCC 35603 = DSM 2933]